MGTFNKVYNVIKFFSIRLAHLLGKDIAKHLHSVSVQQVDETKISVFAMIG